MSGRADGNDRDGLFDKDEIAKRNMSGWVWQLNPNTPMPHCQVGQHLPDV